MLTFKEWQTEQERELRRNYKDYVTSMLEADELDTMEDWHTWVKEEYQVQKEHEAEEKVCV